MEHERMPLTGRNREALLSAAREPLPPAARLIAALRRHDRTLRYTKNRTAPETES
jgi:hypothetical protein